MRHGHMGPSPSVWFGPAMDLSGLKEIVKDLTQSAESRAVSRALKCYAKGQMVKASLHSAYYLALCHEALREYDPAASIYRMVAKNNSEELPKILGRLEALLAKDYQNAALRLAVGDLFLRSGRANDAVQQFSLVLETDPRGAGPVAERIKDFLKEKGETPELRWLMVSA